MKRNSKNLVGWMRHSFNKISKKLTELRFDKATIKRMKKISTMLGMVPPNVDRVKENRNQLSFVKEIDGYIIWAHTSWNPITRLFSKNGRVNIVISKPTNKGYKRLYTTFFYRRGDFASKVCKQLEFLVSALENRPLDSNGKRMELKETSPCVYKWCSTTTQEKISFFGDVPLKLSNFIRSREKQKLYFERIRISKLGIKKRARKIRIPHKVTKPENAMQ